MNFLKDVEEVIIKPNRDGTFNLQSKLETRDAIVTLTCPRANIKLEVECLKDDNDDLYGVDIL